MSLKRRMRENEGTGRRIEGKRREGGGKKNVVQVFYYSDLADSDIYFATKGKRKSETYERLFPKSILASFFSTSDFLYLRFLMG